MNYLGKKSIYSILLVVMLLMLNSVSAFGAESKTITLTGGSVKRGSTVTVDVNIDNVQSLAGLQLTMEYDNSKLETEEDDIVNGLSGFQSAKNVLEDKSYLKYSAVSAVGMDETDSVTLLSVKFRVKENADLGETIVKISDAFASTDDMEEITLNTVDGVIKIKGESSGGGSDHDKDDDSDKPEDEEHSETKDDTKEEAPKETETEKSDFKDVDNYSWAETSIKFLSKNNIMKGTGEHEFSPSNNIKRADYMLIVIRILGLEEQKSSKNFDDVDESMYYYNALAVAKSYGYANGTGGNNFNPEGEISRQDLFVLTHRILVAQNIIKSSGSDNTAVLETFTDNHNISDYAREAIAELISMGLVKGSSNMINPQGKATRAETAVFVERIYNLMQQD